MSGSTIPADASSAEIINRLAFMFYTLDVFPDDTRLAEFMRAALLSIPAIKDLLFCIRGRLVPSDPRFQPICSRCEQATESPDDLDWTAVKPEAESLYFPIRSFGTLFGVMILIPRDAAALAPYMSFLRNSVSRLATLIDVCRYQSRLRASNANLSDLRNELEIRVADRTKELVARNHELVHEVEERKILASALEEREHRLYELAYFDPLTGLLTHRAFVEGMTSVIKAPGDAGRLVAVIAINIEQFGRIADQLGTHGTNEILRAVGARLRSVTIAAHLVARARGGTFYVGSHTLHTKEELDQRLRAVLGPLESIFTIEGQKFTLHFSCGVAILPNDAEDIETLIVRAEAAAHLVPNARSRENPVYYSPELAARMRRRLTIEEDLRDALDAGQLYLVYQPRCSLKDGRVTGAEALLRWNHPTLGNVPPGEFIPIAEESSVIGRIGAWVIRNVCRQLGEWQNNNVPVKPVSLNLTMRDVLSPSTLELLAGQIAEAGITPSLIQVEITEGTAMLDAEATKSFMNRLHEMDVACIIDDFGVGYSSLAYLFDLPFSILKIDKRFIDRIPDRRARSLVRSIVAMAQALGLKVVAEGVEHEYQAEFLRECNCDSIQGYLFSKPLPEPEFVEFIRARAQGSRASAN